MMLDLRDEERGRRDMVKALVAQSADNVLEETKFQFPEYFEIDPFEQAKTEDGTYDIDRIDDSAVDWATAGSAEEDEALSRLIEEMESGSVGADEFE
jgi:hypothetical protein